MSGYRSRGSHAPHSQSHKSHSPGSRADFYDDPRSRSNSPEPRGSSSHRQSPPYDAPRGPSQHHNRYRDRDRSPYNAYEHGRDRRSHQDRRYSPSPQRRIGREGYERSRSRNRNRSHSRSRSTSRDSRDRPSSRGRPSKEVMVEGLGPHLTENDISNELQLHYHVKKLDDVRIIRDRQTKQSRQFGFLRFPTLKDAESFMDNNYPTIYLYGSNAPGKGSDDAKVRIAYGKERKEARVEDGDWMCRICNINNYATRSRCFRCQSLKPGSPQLHQLHPSLTTEEQPAIQKATNVGDNDAAPDNTPSQFLLLRGLEPSVSEELLVKGVSKLNKPAGPQATSNQPFKKAKVASTTGDANLGAREGTLRRILLVRDRRTNESWRYGFAEYASIEDAQAAMTRYNSFDRFTIASKQVLVSYIHAGVFVPVLNATPSTERFTFSPLGNPSMKLAYFDEEAYVAELVVSAPEPSREGTKSNLPSADLEGLRNVKESEKQKKRKAQEAAVPSVKKAASHLQFWSNRHAELHGLQQTSETKSNEHEDGPVTPSRSYADREKNCCYLCMRQFVSTAEVNQHERLSELHRQNLKDETKVKRAEHKMEKHNVQQPSAAAVAEYRDRARERRKIHGVINKKGEQVGSGPRQSKPSPEKEEAAVPGPSKGAALLSKMGYTAGQGLGASGEGMTAPINQDIYVAGVGLGAQGGKVGDAVAEAARNTKGDYGAFAERTRDGARERYSRM